MDCRTVQQKIMPYIERKLPDEEMEEFLDHVENCPSCNDELEVYFTIYYALQKLDSDDTESFDMQEILKEDMEKMRNRLQKHESVRFIKKFLYVLLGMAIGIIMFVGIDALIHGGLSNGLLYQWVVTEETDQPQTNRMTSRPVPMTEKKEPETNHKKQVIVTVPETECYAEPGPIPD